MGTDISSNLATPTVESPVFTGLFVKSAPTKNKSAPSLYDIVFMVEGPNYKSEEQMALEVKIINCNGDVSKRWYVEYYTVDQISKKRVRNREYGRVNYEKDHDKRLTLLLELQKSVYKIQNPAISQNPEFAVTDEKNITFYLNEYLADKRDSLSKASIKNITGSLVYFHDFLKTQNLTRALPSEITKDNIRAFKANFSNSLSNRSVRNHMEFVCTFFNYLINNYENVLYKNPFKGIDKPISNSEKHVAYSLKQANEIVEYLQETDVNTLNFCRFIAIGFLRPKEARALKICDIDFDQKTITLPAANAKVKERTVKPMLDVFFNYLLQMNIQNFPPNYYVFTTESKPGIKKAYDNCFQRRFKKVKDHFGYSRMHTMYGLRHTIVCDLLKSTAPWVEIMKYTGHKTLEAFGEYAKSLLNEPATDLSHHIKIKM